MDYGREWEDVEGEEYIVYRKYWLKNDKLVIERLLSDIGINGVYKLIKKLGEEDENVRSKFDVKYGVQFRIDFVKICYEYGWNGIEKYNIKFAEVNRKKRKYNKKDVEYINKMKDLGFSN
jgi:hypothetical protein